MAQATVCVNNRTVRAVPLRERQTLQLSPIETDHQSSECDAVVRSKPSLSLRLSPYLDPIVHDPLNAAKRNDEPSQLNVLVSVAVRVFVTTRKLSLFSILDWQMYLQNWVFSDMHYISRR